MLCYALSLPFDVISNRSVNIFVEHDNISLMFNFVTVRSKLYELRWFTTIDSVFWNVSSRWHEGIVQDCDIISDHSIVTLTRLDSTSRWNISYNYAVSTNSNTSSDFSCLDDAVIANDCVAFNFNSCELQ